MGAFSRDSVEKLNLELQFLLNFMDRCRESQLIIQLYVFKTLLFWLSLTALIASFYTSAGSSVTYKEEESKITHLLSRKNQEEIQIHTNLVSIVVHFEAKESLISLRNGKDHKHRGFTVILILYKETKVRSLRYK